jgi:hypothetical protein
MASLPDTGVGAMYGWMHQGSVTSRYTKVSLKCGVPHRILEPAETAQ